MSDAASEMGISRSYLSELRSGSVTKLKAIGKENLEAICRYTNKSLVQAQLVVGQLELEDFVKAGSDLQDRLRRAIRFIATEEAWMSFVCSRSEDWPLDAQIAIVRAYEATGGKTFLAEFSPEQIASVLEHANLAD